MGWGIWRRFALFISNDTFGSHSNQSLYGTIQLLATQIAITNGHEESSLLYLHVFYLMFHSHTTYYIVHI